MTDDKYLKAIDETQRLLGALLNDPEHGKLTFKGANDLTNLIIAGPCDLNDLMPGAVVIIDEDEWMALNAAPYRSQQWQHFNGIERATSRDLYIHALKNADNLRYAHPGY